MERLYEDRNIEIRLDSVNKCIEYSWKDFVPSKEYIELLKKVYHYSIQYECDKNLVDMRNMKVIPEDVMEWMQTDWLPRMLQEGIVKFELINTKSVIASMTVGQIVDGVREIGNERGLRNAFFDDLDGSGQRCVRLLLRDISCRPEVGKQTGQDMLLSRKSSPPKTFDTIRTRHHQPQRIDFEASNDTGIQAFEVQHQQVFIKAGLRVHDIAARTFLSHLHIRDVRSHVALSVQTRQI